MKREYWENLGLEHELVNLIMAENGRDIEAFRNANSELEAKVAALTAQIDGLNADIEEYKACMTPDEYDLKIEELKAGYISSLDRYKKEAELKAVFMKAGFGSELAMEAALARYIAESIDIDAGNTAESVTDWLLKLKKAYPEAFSYPEHGEYPYFDTGTPGSDDAMARGDGIWSRLKKLGVR